jgi:ATP-binding cassette subfamily B protein/subfamily B ATP-binding cassette protein MsbA
MTHGYQDEEILGKPYDARLVRRLLSFVRPYTRQVVAAVAMLLVVAGFELALPYLTKLAIDDYIVATARTVRVAEPAAPGSEAFLRSHADDLVPLGTAAAGVRSFVVPSKVLSKYDPREVARATSAGIVTDETWYLAEPDAVERAGIAGSPGLVRAGDRVAVPSGRLAALSREQTVVLREGDFRGVRNVAYLFLAALLLTFVFTLFQINMMEVTSQRVMYDIRMKVLAHLQRLSLSFFDKNPVGRLVTRATNDVEVLHEMFTTIVITLLRDVFTLIGVVVLLLGLNWRLALVSFAVLPAMVWATAVFSVRIRDAFREVRVRVARINANLQESISGIRVTQIFRREAESFGRFARANHDLFRANMRQLTVFALFMPLMELASSVAIGLVIWYGGGRVLQSTLSLGTLVAFLSYVQMFFRPIRNLAEQYSTMQATMASSERIFLLLDSREMVPEPERPVRPPAVRGRVEFENVWFSYDGTDDVLRDVSFTVEPGQTVAIVGATGAGKTSIISLLERFYDVREGRITLDGVDIRDLEKSFLRSHLGLVMQDVFIFAGDIAGNIRLGNASVTDEKVHEVARHVNAERFIERLPGGYRETVHERGSTLSTGQRQLLAFARALAFDPRILILDEATSNIDTETEVLIQDALRKLMAGRTSIVIAHRLSTIQHADRILVMHKGKVREAGTHQELLAARGYYYRLYRLQYAQ